ncbi:hypothetical protein FY557_12745 [Chryseobacterium sp. SN22]|uniref:energy transducer TonB n=1 Tax=Chryseobacterium sp. SN22 TaxID=2606431 RepID=UPI0011EDFF56|nr:energy transducer TonB [Chryseobacterium sp. SN22]KAA0127483.1 hypothetical protein FY557_12745 [Chryseobacterium sp. SN22]
MKKLFSFLATGLFAFSFSQTYVKVSFDKNQIENIYKGGQKKFETDLSNNLRYTANTFQANGDFKLSFTISDKGEVANVKLLPELYDKSFEREVKRDIKRMKKYFAGSQNQEVSINLNFGRDLPPSDGRIAFQAREPFAGQAGSR